MKQQSPRLRSQDELIVLLRVSMGWIFLFAAIRQIPDPAWSAVSFLSNAKTFPEFFAFFTQPALLSIIDVLIPWVHLGIGLALILGIGMRVAAVVGASLMFLYYLPRLDEGMIGENNFIVDYHFVYTFLLLYLAVVRAGRVYGLEGWIIERPELHQRLLQYRVVRWFLL